MSIQINALKRLRNEYIKIYDKFQREKHFIDEMIEYYVNKWKEIQELVKPLRIYQSQEEDYIKEKYLEFRREFEAEYEGLSEAVNQLAMTLVDLNEMLGYDPYDMESEDEW